ncbi:MAG: PAS domain-containing sensor histidine kinase, partial [Burkholderiaceae bacterium]|nr:PAS domain-containing sensor histidine kinase [Burkholderiaceae bacterium]
MKIPWPVERLSWAWWRQYWQHAWRRWSLWSLLVALVGAVLVTLVWLAGRYEASMVQNQLERDTADAVADIRAGLARNLQNLQALQIGVAAAGQWQAQAQQLLREHRELVRIEWRAPNLMLR